MSCYGSSLITLNCNFLLIIHNVRELCLNDFNLALISHGNKNSCFTELISYSGASFSEQFCPSFRSQLLIITILFALCWGRFIHVLYRSFIRRHDHWLHASPTPEILYSFIHSYNSSAPSFISLWRFISAALHCFAGSRAQTARRLVRGSLNIAEIPSCFTDTPETTLLS